MELNTYLLIARHATDVHFQDHGYYFSFFLPLRSLFLYQIKNLYFFLNSICIIAAYANISAFYLVLLQNTFLFGRRKKEIFLDFYFFTTLTSTLSYHSTQLIAFDIIGSVLLFLFIKKWNLSLFSFKIVFSFKAVYLLFKIIKKNFRYRVEFANCNKLVIYKEFFKICLIAQKFFCYCS